MITTKSKHLSDVDYIHIHNVLEGIAMHCRAISKSVRMVWRSVADRITPTDGKNMVQQAGGFQSDLT